MSLARVVMDIGDVLIRTIPMAQYKALGRYTGMAWQEIAEAIESTGIIPLFETGGVNINEFVAAVRAILCHPALRDEEIRESWNAIIAGVDPILASIAAKLADSGRLYLASNTNPLHWQVVQRILAEVGIGSHAFLSFEIGSIKPNTEFFVHLIDACSSALHHGVYVDDRTDNVEAAMRHGLTGWLHFDSTLTAKRLSDLLV